MTTVKVRHVNDSRGFVLGEVSLTKAALDESLALLRSWGLRFESLGEYFQDFSGEFVYDENEIFFEIMVE